MALDLPSAAAVIVVIGAVLAMSGRDGRVVVLGLLIALVASPLIASPLPESLAISARILGGLIAAYMLWLAVASGSVENLGSSLGPIAEAAVAAAAFVVGLSIDPVDPIAGVLPGQAAGLALITLAVIPMVGRDVFRIGIAVALASIGAVLLVETWSGAIPALGQLVVAALLVGIAAATNLLVPAFDETAETLEPAAVSQTEAARPAGVVPAGPAMAAEGQRLIDRTTPTRTDAAATPPQRPRPMTAEPEPDDWLAWSRPEHRAERRSRSRHRSQATRPSDAGAGDAGNTGNAGNADRSGEDPE